MYVTTKDIDRLALELRGKNIAPTGELMTMLAAYANNLFFRTLLIRNEHKREDAVQEACSKALETFNQFNPHIEGAANYSTIFHRICWNIKNNEIKVAKKKTAVRLDTDISRPGRRHDTWIDSVSSDAPSAVEQLIEKESGEAIKRLLGNDSPLTKVEKKVLQLRIDGIDIAEISKELGHQQNYVYTTLNKVIKKARNIENFQR